jgi:hemoglobin
MGGKVALLEALGGEAGCRQLSKEFYARVGKDSVLRPLFPGKSLRCAINEFAAFLIQFLGGDEEQTQDRWWLSLRESHARFEIDAAQRSAWLKHMGAALQASPFDEETRTALRQFFLRGSGYVIGVEASAPEQEELATRWTAQRSLDDAIAAIAAGRDSEAIALAPRFASRPSVYVGLLTRMMQAGHPEFIRFVVHAAEQDPALATGRFNGRTLLHFASGAGCSEVVSLLLRLGTDPNVQDHGGHTPLYRVANECAAQTGPEIVRALVRAGADVNAHGGVTRATPLHMAARRGFTDIARALLDCGATIDVRDKKGDTPLERAMNCRQEEISRLLAGQGNSTRI